MFSDLVLNPNYRIRCRIINPVCVIPIPEVGIRCRIENSVRGIKRLVEILAIDMQRFLGRAKIETKLIRKSRLGIEPYGIRIPLDNRNEIAAMIKFMDPGNGNAVSHQRLPDKIRLAAACECLPGINSSQLVGGGDSRDKLNSRVCGEG